MNEADIIKKQREKIEELEKKLHELGSGSLPDLKAFTDVLDTLKSGQSGNEMHKAAEELNKVAEQLKPILKALSRIPKEVLAKYMTE